MNASPPSVQEKNGFIRFRTFVLVAAPLIIPIAFTVFIVPWRQQAALEKDAIAKAEVLTSMIAANAAAAILFEDQASLQSLVESAAEDPDATYVVGTTAEGRKLATFGKPPGELRGQLGDAQSWTDGDLLHVYAPVQKSGQVVGGIQAGFSRERILQEANRFRMIAVLLSAAVLALAAIIAAFLGRQFSELFERLRRSIFDTARRVDEVVNQLATATAEQTTAAGEESAALHETNATAAEVGHAVSQVAQRATTLAESATRAEEAGAEGLDAVVTGTRGMREVREQMNSIATAIGALLERAAAIGDIASTVALLSERTNLLALNAAIEAARAGAQGRGFSVVAQEMRALADGSNRSAAQVKAITAEIQAAIARAVADVREGERRVRNAETLAESAGDSIKRFVEVTRNFAATGREMSGSAHQQKSAIEQIVESISHATQAGSTQLETTRQVEETSRQLRQLSRELLEVISAEAKDGAAQTDVRTGAVRS